MAIVRKTGLSVSIFSLGGSDYLCDLDNATLNVEVSEEDARGVCDEWAYPWATSRSWSLEAEVFVNAVAALVTETITGDAQVAVIFNTGANAYTGTGLVKTANHTVTKGGLQKCKVTISGQGGLTVA